MLPADDLSHLMNSSIEHSVTTEANVTCVILRGFRLPPGFDKSQSDLLLRLSPGYPDVPPDMWWFDPPLKRADGTAIPATDVVENHLGRRWQRWSRHLQPGQWRSGVDSLESFLALVRSELNRSVPVPAQ